MSEQETFIIDSNSFITPYNQYYSFIFESEFWKEIEKHTKSGSIILIKSVKDEILNGDDELAFWISNIDVKVLSDRQNKKIINNYRSIINYLNNDSVFSKKAQQSWLLPSIADPWIIASAIETKSTIITFEKKVTVPNKTLIEKAKIPNIANHFGVKVADLFYMMRTLRFKL